ncbi:hypothetical protein NIES3804_17250 [Microcystis aeruginosa NIES-3804]|uniref:Rad50/SbcC-type AAA domain-containing protein n=1 Tax=Microcystis aeruginosa NIES-3804 TaxID=2517783 RepID=A0A6H9GW07_MICAE|nr:AAA family ATPase [Microcystis aeruginosa]GCL50162.1 hypothetical protein NIES3804_17250 [Microcystis aeruginosa NIES-3804]
MITSLELRNFTAFRRLKIDFSPKINVIIGENGTGKREHLTYAMSINTYSSQKLENLQLDHKEK